MVKTAEERAQPGLSSLQRGLLVLLVLTLLASVGLRAYGRVQQQGDAPSGGRALVAGEGETRREPATPLERSLPYVTEGSFFGLLGFALGYATRRFVKLGLILLALFFLGLQALVWTGTVSVDWSGLVGKLDTLLFNLRTNESMPAFLTRRIPAAGAMLAGYLFGFQRA